MTRRSHAPLRLGKWLTVWLWPCRCASVILPTPGLPATATKAAAKGVCTYYRCTGALAQAQAASHGEAVCRWCSLRI